MRLTILTASRKPVEVRKKATGSGKALEASMVLEPKCTDRIKKT